jgi:hypothetical protein
VIPKKERDPTMINLTEEHSPDKDDCYCFGGYATLTGLRDLRSY